MNLPHVDISTLLLDKDHRIICERTIEAIQKICLIETFYKEARLPTLFEPFLIGQHKTTGNILIRGYYISGYSKRKEPALWRLYNIKDFHTNITVISGKRYSRHGYNPNDSAFRNYLARI